jgi:hypothetical protein
MKQQLFIRTTIIAGVCTGLATFLLTLLLFYVGLKPLGKQFFLFLPVYGALMMLFMTWYRNYKNSGLLSGSKAIVMALLINVLACLFYASSLYLFLRFSNTTMLAEHHTDLIKLLTDNKDILIKDSGIDSYQKHLDSIQQVSPANIATDILIKSSIGGFFVAIIMALGLRK